MLMCCVLVYYKNKDRPGIGAEQVKTASFFINTSFSFAKTNLDSRSRPGCKRHGHLGVGEVQTRIFMDSSWRCGDVYLPCQGHFCGLFLYLIRRERVFFQMIPFLVMAVFVSCKHKQHITWTFETSLC